MGALGPKKKKYIYEKDDNILIATEFTDSILIKVFGSGTIDVNGLYVHDGIYNEWPRYKQISGNWYIRRGGSVNPGYGFQLHREVGPGDWGYYCESTRNVTNLGTLRSEVEKPFKEDAKWVAHDNENPVPQFVICESSGQKDCARLFNIPLSMTKETRSVYNSLLYTAISLSSVCNNIVIDYCQNVLKKNMTLQKFAPGITGILDGVYLSWEILEINGNQALTNLKKCLNAAEQSGKETIILFVKPNVYPIEVLKSGTPEVNGLYIYDGNYRDWPRYVQVSGSKKWFIRRGGSGNPGYGFQLHREVGPGAWGYYCESTRHVTDLGESRDEKQKSFSKYAKWVSHAHKDPVPKFVICRNGLDTNL